MAGHERGLYLLPEVNDEVLVAFEHGDARFPFVLGALWNGKDRPPAGANPDGKNNVRLLRSRSGHVVKLDDTPGKEKVEIETAGGKNRVVLDSARNTITIEAGENLQLEAKKGKLVLRGQQVVIESGSEAKIEAKGKMDLKAGPELNVKGGVVNLN
jgi:uncharacterized protein involved in type VI secretion and phage assembly